MRSFFLAVGLGTVLALTYAGCGLTVEGELADTSGSPPTSSSSSTGGADAGAECTTRDQCPVDTECTTYDCKAGQCAPAFKPEGTLLTGGVAGDCKKLICQGGGKKAEVPDDMDVPKDNNPCIVKECAAGIVQSSKAADGTPCGAMGKLACVDGLCEGCNQDKNNCPMPTDCKEYECLVNTCIETILEGKVLDDPLPNDCKINKCDANGDVVQQNDTDGAKCADPANACYEPSVCAAGMCTPKPKQVGAPGGPDPVDGDCKALFCDNMSMPVEGPDNTDLPVDTNLEDCKAPTCVGGRPGMEVVVPEGTECGPGGAQRCCGMNCCNNTGDYCDMAKMCCMSGQVCGGTCCMSDHDCDGTACCPMQQRCANKVCCPNTMKCEMGACVPL